MPQVALVAGAVASVAGTYISYKNQKKAAAAQQRQQELTTRRSRRQAIRQAQIARAQAVASASASGATGSSAAQGGQGSVGSQLGADFGFSSAMSGLSRNISTYTSRAQTGQALAGLGGLGISYGTSQGASFGDLFPNKTQPNKAPLMNFGSQYGASGVTSF